MKNNLIGCPGWLKTSRETTCTSNSGPNSLQKAGFTVWIMYLFFTTRVPDCCA